jgi:hypothetical protein
MQAPLLVRAQRQPQTDSAGLLLLLEWMLLGLPLLLLGRQTAMVPAWMQQVLQGT